MGSSLNGEQRTAAIGANLRGLLAERTKHEARRAYIDSHLQRRRLHARQLAVGHRRSVGEVRGVTDRRRII